MATSGQIRTCWCCGAVLSPEVHFPDSCRPACQSVERRPVEPAGAHPLVRGQVVDWETAWQHLLERVRGAVAPLVVGLDELSCQAQVECWKLAEQWGACLDRSRHPAGLGPLQAFQRWGGVSATWGELVQRADLILDWSPGRSALPACLRLQLQTQPVQPSLWRIGNGPLEGATGLVLDRPGRLNLATVLRRAFQSGELNETQTASCGLPADQVRDLWQAWQSASYVGVLMGSPDQPAERDLESELLARLVMEANDRVPTVALKGDTGLNGLGAEQVLTANAGYPRAISFQRGLPEHWGSEFTGQKLLDRQECDLLLDLGGRREEADGPPGIPRIVVGGPPDESAQVYLPCRRLGIEESGDRLRSDGIMILLPAVAAEGPAAAELPSSVTLLRELQQRLAGAITG